MHTRVIVLLKADDKKSALSKVKTFLELYYEDVYDWYVIGGRWNNLLAPKRKEFDEFASKLCNPTNGSFINQNDVDKNQKELQAEWERLGMKGDNSWCNHYDLSEDGNEYDVLPLFECVEYVKSQCQNKEVQEQEAWNSMVAARENNPKDTMSAYYAGIYRNIKYSDFSLETSVYDVETQESELVPDDIAGYFAIVVDMHN